MRVDCRGLALRDDDDDDDDETREFYLVLSLAPSPNFASTKAAVPRKRRNSSPGRERRDVGGPLPWIPRIIDGDPCT